MSEAGWSRREFARALAMLGVALGAPGCVTMAALNPSDAPSVRELAILDAVADLVFPRTDTPGAVDAGVGAFVALALAHGLDGARRRVAPANIAGDLAAFLRPDGSLRHVSWLAAQLGEDWLGKSVPERIAILTAMDSAAYAPGADAHPWRAIKGMIVTGYYTSEAGGSMELLYSAIPGRFDPRIAVSPSTRAMSNDWTSVDFG